MIQCALRDDSFLPSSHPCCRWHLFTFGSWWQAFSRFGWADSLLPFRLRLGHRLLIQKFHELRLTVLPKAYCCRLVGLDFRVQVILDDLLIEYL